MLDTREKVAHLLRRFGLGASYPEVESYSRLGFDGALNKLLHYEGVDEDYNVSPWSFAFDNTKNMVSLDNSRFYSWWASKMLLTNRPVQENLTLFWHNHFAVSGSKIEDGSQMLGYLDTLRENAIGNFRTMLGKVARDAAMVHWLDSDTNVKGKPNENFGREVMELFTLGIGNYSEMDVREAARAFTGWSTKYSVNFPPKTPYVEQIRMNVAAGRPMYCFADCPELHDDGFKTVLGKRGQWTADDVFDILVHHPAHAPYLMKKMWTYFAYPNPDPKTIEKVCKVYVDNKFEIRPVLHYIATCDEFWSPEAMRSIVKSPVAYTISVCRQLGIKPALAKNANFNPALMEPVAGNLLGMGYFLCQVMQKQGLQLLFPPDVSGWRWGTHWITSASMMERARIGDYLFKQRQGLVVPGLWKDVTAAYSPKTTDDIVNALVDWFDAPMDDQQKQILVKAADAAGGVKAFAKPQTAGKVIDSVFALIASAPQYQML